MTSDRGIYVYGDITPEELNNALLANYPDKSFVIMDRSENSLGTTEEKLQRNEEEIQKLRLMIQRKDSDIEAMDLSLRDLNTIHAQSIAQLHDLQVQLFQDYMVVRKKYDVMKQSLFESIWMECAKYHPGLKTFLTLKMEDESYVESETRFGGFTLGKKLGEGQFGNVWTCRNDDSETELAVKIILKERLTSFTSMTRLAKEIEILRKLPVSDNIIKFEDVIQTFTTFYLVTEKGGPDLFDFLERYPDGVSEEWARDIISRIIRGVHECHLYHVCHRDLKPENILISFDEDQGKCIDLKLCDFGLGCDFSTRSSLEEFCGTPGFYCPEMVLDGHYFGNKADVWSLGCVIINILLGPEVFCEIWMVAYNFEVSQDTNLFGAEIDQAMKNLPQALSFLSSDCVDFAQKFLKRSNERWRLEDCIKHPWIKMMFPNGLPTRSANRINLDMSSPRLAAANGIESGHTNQAFELWYVLHFQFLDTAIGRKAYFKILSKILGKSYKKNDISIVKMIFQEGNIRNAINYANNLESNHDGKTASASWPVTRVHHLVQRLLDYAKIEY